MTPLPAVRDSVRSNATSLRRPGPLALAAGAIVGAVAVGVAGVVALALAAAVALVALLAALVGTLAFFAWRVRGGRRSSGWREAKVGDAWVGYRWDAHGSRQG